MGKVRVISVTDSEGFQLIVQVDDFHRRADALNYLAQLLQVLLRGLSLPRDQDQIPRLLSALLLFALLQVRPALSQQSGGGRRRSLSPSTAFNLLI